MFNQLEALGIAALGLSRLNVLVVITIGRDGNLADFLNFPENVFVERYVDQVALLQYCSLVVSHGGAGTVLGAAACGVPQLILPQAADHFRNARALCKAGAALVIGHEQCSPETVQSRAFVLLTAPAYTVAARRLSDEIRLMPISDDVITQLEKF